VEACTPAFSAFGLELGGGLVDGLTKRTIAGPHGRRAVPPLLYVASAHLTASALAMLRPAATELELVRPVPAVGSRPGARLWVPGDPVGTDPRDADVDPSTGPAGDLAVHQATGATGPTGDPGPMAAARRGAGPAEGLDPAAGRRAATQPGGAGAGTGSTAVLWTPEPRRPRRTRDRRTAPTRRGRAGAATGPRPASPLLVDFAGALGLAIDPGPALAPPATAGPWSPFAPAAPGDLEPDPDGLDDLEPDPTAAAAEARVAATAEAVRFFRGAARQEPADYLPDLAGALVDHSVALEGGGFPDAAVGVAQDAVTIRQHLAKQDPRHLPHLADGLVNLAARLGSDARHDDRVAALEDVVAIRRHLAQAHPARHLPSLAHALDELATGLRAAERHHEQVVALEDAVAIRRHLARVLPERFHADLADSLHALALALPPDRRTEALGAVDEAVAIRRRLAGTDPGRYLPDLATSLHTLSVGLGALGQHPEGLAAGEEATQLYRHLADHRPGWHADDLATALENLAISLGAMGRRADARAAGEQALVLRRRSRDAAHRPSAGRDRCRCACHHPTPTIAARPALLDATATTGEHPAVDGRPAPGPPGHVGVSAGSGARR
jgi:tetratricopeptide (TPR) repeat protein